MHHQSSAAYPAASADTVHGIKAQSAVNFLFVVAITADLLTPFLIWKGVVPASMRWISYAAIAVMIFGVFTRMSAFDHVPGMMWLVAFISVIGVCVAFIHGQDIVSTLWGWWAMFQYPFVGFFAYLQPRWPEAFSRHLRVFCVVVLAVELSVQIGQYLTGEIPGDNLAGTFGKHGTGNLVLFVSLVLCLALGEWLAAGKWTQLILVLVLGSISSALGEVKLFLPTVALLGLLVMVIRAIQGHNLLKTIAQAVVVGIALLAFVKVYDVVVPGARSTPLEKYMKSPEALINYLDRADKSKGATTQGYYYDIGRNYALDYGWRSIQRDTLTFSLGMGLGARGESKTLGTAGTGLTQGYLGLSSGTSLLVIMQETGLLGLITLAGFLLWVVVSLARDIRKAPYSEAAGLRYGLLLFTLLWPIWLWYNTAWTLRVPMLLYWGTLGYVMSEASGRLAQGSTLTASSVRNQSGER